MSKITIIIKNGEIISKVNGILGTGCKNTDKFLKQLGTVKKENKTKEYYQSEIEVIENVKLQR